MMTPTADASPWVGNELDAYLAYSLDRTIRNVAGQFRLIIPVLLTPVTIQPGAEISNWAKVFSHKWINGVGKPDEQVADEIAAALAIAADRRNPAPSLMPINNRDHIDKTEEQASPTMPEQVQLLPLIMPPIEDLGTYDIRRHWDESARIASAGQSRTQDNGSFSIPIGQLVDKQTLTLDFVNDGPHGLLIGHTGTGKSELLRSIVAALALRYSPDEVNFVLVDYKAGLEPVMNLASARYTWEYEHTPQAQTQALPVRCQ